MVAVYRDDPKLTPADQLRSEAAVTVSDTTTLPAELEELRLPAGRYACATHVGSYAGLGDSWARLKGEWLPQSDQQERTRDGLSYELYLNDPSTTAEAQLKTEIYLPLV